MKIADAMNTYNPSLHLISSKGYEIGIQESGSDSFDWEAKKGDNIYVASDPLRLLALVLIGEELGEQWKNLKTGDLYNQILDKHFD